MARAATAKATSGPSEAPKPRRTRARRPDAATAPDGLRGPPAAPEPAPVASLGQIEQWPLDRLKPYARNSRTHSKDQVAKIANSIRQFGFTNPVLAAEDGTIIAGHGRVQAEQLLKMATVPVLIASGWSAEQRKAYVITDNKLALDAGWDDEILKLELGELAEAGFDLEETGFTEDDMNRLFGTIVHDVKPPEIKASFQILIECRDEAQQLELLEDLQARAIECRALIS